MKPAPKPDSTSIGAKGKKPSAAPEDPALKGGISPHAPAAPR
jgi:hypothetical protein